jgi:hypothetical protein
MRKPGSKNIVMSKELFRLRVEKFLVWFDKLYPLHGPKILQRMFDFSQLLYQLSLAVRDLLLMSVQEQCRPSMAIGILQPINDTRKGAFGRGP